MPPIESLSGVAESLAATAPAPIATTGSAEVPQTDTVAGADFQNALGGAIDNLQGLSSASNAASTAAVTGDLNDIHEAMIASSRASVTLELVAAVRNKGVDAFNEIMRMQA